MALERATIFIEGRVQGVGFRPAVFRYARQNNLKGFVCNTSEGVYIEAEGNPVDIEKFIRDIKNNSPKQSIIKKITVTYSPPLKNETEFVILESKPGKKIQTELSPDIATCKKCLEELFNPEDRRYLFPFINCTDCGPRFTITKKLPYDRKNTTMVTFRMCPACFSEYHNISDRRFHAQPNCCFACGPEFYLIEKGKIVKKGLDAIKISAGLIDKGYIIAVKGIGGYLLICDAENEEAVKELRKRKKRGDKPFAVMARNIETVKRYSYVNHYERNALCSWQAPVVILKKREDCHLPEEIAPFNRYLGFFLPYAPIHHLLFFFGQFNVIVATSANIAESPIIFRDGKRDMEKLLSLTDYILSHNRPIQAGCDDSVVKIFEKSIYIIRKARGYTPETLKTPFPFRKEVFAAGPGEKNTFSLGRESSIITSQHIGTLSDISSFNFYRDMYHHFIQLFGFLPEMVAYDLHPDYLTTQFAREMIEKKGISGLGIQHHHAHIASCMLENNLPNQKVIGVAMDGTGYGEEGDIRGAEVLIADYKTYQRYAFLDYTPLPGGEKAIKEVWRTGISFLYKAFGKEIFNLDIPFLRVIEEKKKASMVEMIEKGINTPLASSMGRLFDAVSAILGIRIETTYDAQAAIELEMSAGITKTSGYNFGIKESQGRFIIEPSTVVRDIVEDIKRKTPTGKISYRFHKGISAIITEICKRIKEERNISSVVLSGGVFQNLLLLNMVYRQLKGAHFSVYIHRLLPPNDGCISTGQAVISLYFMKG